MIRGKMVDRTCQNCKTSFQAREADVKRGWGKFCSKSCKAVKQEARTGQYARYLSGQSNASLFSNAHQFSNEE